MRCQVREPPELEGNLRVLECITDVTNESVERGQCSQPDGAGSEAGSHQRVFVNIHNKPAVMFSKVTKPTPI